MDKIKIGKRTIGDGEPALIIAEAGINHNGSMETAKRLVDIAAEAEVDAVKFQKRSPEDLLIREALDAPYTGTNSFGKTYGEHRQKLELSDRDFQELFDYTEKKGLIFIASVWDLPSADFIDGLGVAVHKVPSADVTNLPLLEHVARFGKPVLLSTGMSEMDEIETAVNAILQHNKKLVLLECTSTYPSEPEEINLGAIAALRDKFGLPTGFSSHERGIALTEAAIALGAVVIERHFTLDRTLPGSDHAASLESAGLKKLVRDIRNIERAMSTGDKKIHERERPIRKKLGKSLVTKKPIPKGTELTSDFITAKGPGTGIRPSDIASVLGKRAKRDLEADILINMEDLE